MANLSKIRREKMLNYLEKLKELNNDDENIRAITEIENALNEKKYGLVWEEHSEKVDEMLEHNIPIFIEDETKKITANEGEAYNFLFEGDNLHSLKLLEKTHKGKIDVIYIDPPYNTGNKDFIYDDCFVEKTDGYSHSKWLSFMEKRILIAMELLADEGYFFISINNYEFGQLKLLMDSMLGEANFIGCITWESTTQPINAGTAKYQLQQKSEYIYCYSKNYQKKKEFILKNEEANLKYPHDGKYGKCRFEILEKSDAGQYRRDSMKYKILGMSPRVGKRWQIGEMLARQLEKEGKVEIVDGIVKRAIYPEDELDKLKELPFWSHFSAKEFGTAQNGKEQLNKIIGYPVGFDTVKPLGVLKEIFCHFMNDITILDFFAGSGTTGHAVMQLNKEDGGNRKYILCTNNENNICEEVTYQRLKNIQEELPHNLKYYKTDFIPKFSYDEASISDKMMEHIRELIELEYAIELDGKKYIVLNDEEGLDEAISKIKNGGKLFVRSGIFLSRSNQRIFEEKGVSIIEIPEYYFREELKEVGEL